MILDPEAWDEDCAEYLLDGLVAAHVRELSGYDLTGPDEVLNCYTVVLRDAENKEVAAGLGPLALAAAIEAATWWKTNIHEERVP